MIKSSNLVACICEGNSEKYIMEILLQEELLLFNKEQLLDGRFLVNIYRSPKVFTNQFLNMDYGENKIVILLIVDSKNIKFKLDSIYNDKIEDKYFVITAPELEMLMIHSSGLYNEYIKTSSTASPSKFLANTWKTSTKKIKSKEFIYGYFEKHSLVDAIIEHKRKTQKSNKKNHIFLADILKKTGG